MAVERKEECRFGGATTRKGIGKGRESDGQVGRRQAQILVVRICSKRMSAAFKPRRFMVHTTSRIDRRKQLVSVCALDWMRHRLHESSEQHDSSSLRVEHNEDEDVR